MLKYMSTRHPVLRGLYANLAEYQKVVFLDESIDIADASDASSTRGFYIVAGSVLMKDVLEDTRIRLRKIVGGDYFHTTEALQTDDGTKTVHSLLRQCQKWDDNHLLVVKTRLAPGDNTEHTRQQCLTALITNLDTNTRALIFEKRKTSKENNADQALIKKLRKTKVLSDQTRTVWVSPSDERLLWLPDLVAMAYRRTITHTDETRLLFPQYLQQSTTIIPTFDTQPQQIPETSFSLLEHPHLAINTNTHQHQPPHHREPETTHMWEHTPEGDNPLEN